jgi:hydrogenase expression/formation protein HypD
MKYIEGFRNPGAALALRERIDAAAAALPAPTRIMEVCGSHTMAIARYGIRSILPSNVLLLSGPGCPVCVTDAGYIDAAIALAEGGALIATFGDMLHVPGSRSTLSACRAAGLRVEVCYSPSAALELARHNPDREVVFLAIGFETTIAPTVTLVEAALRNNMANLSLLTAFKLVPPALQALRADPEMRIDAFLCPAHVSAIIGSDAYLPFAGQGGVPCVVAGFEPLDILMGIESILSQIARGEARVENEYSRVVRPSGNPKAQAMMQRYLEPADAAWRGIGTIPQSGLVLRSEYARFDAERKLGIRVTRGEENPACSCGEVIKGKIQPSDCRMFAAGCTPDHPLGPCMVSSEGSCSAYFKYLRAG